MDGYIGAIAGVRAGGCVSVDIGDMLSGGLQQALSEAAGEIHASSGLGIYGAGIEGSLSLSATLTTLGSTGEECPE